MSTIIASRFQVGRLYTTPGALSACIAAGVSGWAYIERHQAGDWSEMDPEDQQANELAVRDGSRVFSRYTLPGGERIWIITEADRASTTVLLPSEY